MRTILKQTICVAMAAALAAMPPAFGAEGDALRVDHTPVTFAVRGQPLTLKAKVTGPEDQIESVTLYYALFKDAAPFRVPMRPSGLGVFVGTIEAGLLTGVDSVSYYIEAMDKNGALSETPWQTVNFKDSRSPVAATPAPVPAPAAPPIKPEKQRSSAVTVGLIAGGAAAVVGGALLLSDDGGGGGGGGGGGDTNVAQKAGTYSGSATSCVTPSGGPTVCSNRAITIVIDSRGTVLSENIETGQTLTGSLAGNDFTLVGSVNDGAGTTGDRIYSGTVVNNNRIVGTISGSASSPGGTINFGGSFSAAK